MEQWPWDGVTPIKLLAVASQNIGIVAEKFGQGRSGGCVCVADKAGIVVAKAFVGSPSFSKTAKYWEFAEEKVHRLAMIHRDHISSWQSRNEEANQYGGAIRMENGLLGFSGLPELVDEAFGLGLARVESLISKQRMEQIVHASQNGPLAADIYDLMRRSPGD